MKDRGLRLIALFKFAKALLLIAVGLGALQLLDPDTAARAQRWAAAFATSSDRRVVQHLLARATGLSPGRLEVLALGTFLYAGLFTTEGLGLWLGRRWAEYLTVVATASFVPIEIFEILQRLDLLRVGALVMNLAVVAYLVYRLRRASGPPLPGWGCSGIHAAPSQARQLRDLTQVPDQHVDQRTGIELVSGAEDSIMSRLERAGMRSMGRNSAWMTRYAVVWVVGLAVGTAGAKVRELRGAGEKLASVGVTQTKRSAYGNALDSLGAAITRRSRPEALMAGHRVSRVVTGIMADYPTKVPVDVAWMDVAGRDALYAAQQGRWGGTANAAAELGRSYAAVQDHVRAHDPALDRRVTSEIAQLQDRIEQTY